MGDVQKIRDDSVLNTEVQGALAALGQVIRDQDDVIRLSIAAALGGGHILLEDVPGVGKTSLARGLASVLGLDFQRVQFTSDLLPADIVGGLVLDHEVNRLVFRQGPVFTSMVLADELNRASPRTQSALLEAMEERTVSVDGTTHRLPEPFCVLATQNPLEQHGTYPLPESQLDRFMISLSMGYPSSESEIELLIRGTQTQRALEDLGAQLSAAEVHAIQAMIEAVTVSEEVAGYASRFLSVSRTHSAIHLGASTRGGLAWLMMSRAWAWLAGRSFVTPDDLIEVAKPVWRHRFVMKSVSSSNRADGEQCVDDILRGIDPPC